MFKQGDIIRFKEHVFSHEYMYTLVVLSEFQDHNVTHYWESGDETLSGVSMSGLDDFYELYSIAFTD